MAREVEGSLGCGKQEEPSDPNSSESALKRKGESCMKEYEAVGRSWKSWKWSRGVVLESMSPFLVVSVTHSGSSLWEARINGKRWRSSGQAAGTASHFYSLSLEVGPGMTGAFAWPLYSLHSEWVKNILPLLFWSCGLTAQSYLSFSTVLHWQSAHVLTQQDTFLFPFPFFPLTLLQFRKEVTSQWSYFQVACEFGI